jgi:hypothetical protein
VKQLYGGFVLAFAAAVTWAVLEAFNPDQVSTQFAFLGLRSYALWWFAPLPIATALRAWRERQKALVVLSIVGIVVAGVAALQFSRPPDDPLNAYATLQGQDAPIELTEVTGRVRVTSTFSYITGFADFVVIVPALLLAFSLSSTRGAVRSLAMVSAVACAVTLPMSGSRAPVILEAVALVTVAVYAGVLHSRAKRGIIIAAALAVTMGLASIASEAVQGVRGRFELEDTQRRLLLGLQYIPLVAPAMYDYPVLGQGTGMQQNGAQMLGLDRKLVTEGEPGRYLLELGLIGYLLVTLAKVGLAVALLRCARVLRIRGAGAEAGFAVALAIVGFFGQLTFDHVFQALYFSAVGVVLSSVAPNVAAPRLRPLPLISPAIARRV